VRRIDRKDERLLRNNNLCHEREMILVDGLVADIVGKNIISVPSFHIKGMLLRMVEGWDPP